MAARATRAVPAGMLSVSGRLKAYKGRFDAYGRSWATKEFFTLVAQRVMLRIGPTCKATMSRHKCDNWMSAFCWLVVVRDGIRMDDGGSCSRVFNYEHLPRVLSICLRDRFCSFGASAISLWRSACSRTNGPHVC